MFIAAAVANWLRAAWVRVPVPWRSVKARWPSQLKRKPQGKGGGCPVGTDMVGPEGGRWGTSRVATPLRES